MNRAASIEASLNAIFSAFESGNRNKAVVIAIALWGSNEIRQLRYAAAGSEDLPHQMPEAVFPDSSHAMDLDEPLDYLACALVGITGERNPYAFRMAYPSKKARILKYWSKVKPKLKRDVDRIAPIEALMDEMFYAFESGDKDKGTLIAMALWGGRQISKLR